MTFQELAALAYARIYRTPETAALYGAEDELYSAVNGAADELEKCFAGAGMSQLTSREELLAITLVTILEHFGRSGHLAAQVNVKRYGSADSVVGQPKDA